METFKTIFKTIVGSQAYGTAIPTSDVDYKGIYIQHPDEILTFKYVQQIEKGKDECYYEVRRFLELLKSANPTVLELLFMPKECIIECSPEYQLISAHKEKFLTKKCLNSFGGYAIQQIQKATGLDKKMNWEQQRVERKTPLDFCYYYEDGQTFPLSKYLHEFNMKQELCGLVALDHMRDCYSLYYDYSAQYGMDANRNYQPIGFRGIEIDDGNHVRVSSVPKGMKPVLIMCFNKDAYSIHCKDYFQYQEWLQKRNTQRYVDNKGHNQKIDGKNMLHCRRLIDMAIEIATEKTLNVRRPNADYLLRIRRGEVDLKTLLTKANEDIKTLDSVYANSTLPDNVDEEFVNELLLSIRHFKS